MMKIKAGKTELKNFYCVIKFQRPDGTIAYCFNAGKDKESLQEYWERIEKPDKYILLDMVEVTDKIAVENWFSKHVRLGITLTPNNIVFLNKVTSGEFGKQLYKKYCPHCHKQVIPSEINGYVWQCMDCDEDFYEFECNDM